MDNVTMTVILSLVYLTLSFTSSLSRATSIEIQNNCSYTVWAAATPGGGKQLNQGETWTLYSVNGSGRIWGRTNCVFGHNARGKCESGDCGGRLECEAGANGRAPNTLAEYSMNQSHSGNDVFFVSVVEGFNIPMEFTTSTPQLCSQLMSKCMAEVNEPCPVELRDPGGCNNPCTVFRNSQFCCAPESICEPTSYSKFFKELCPEARTYPSDDSRSYCPNGVGYKVVFCPSISTDSSTNLGSTVFDIWNNCPYTVWAAAVPGGGRRLERGQNWTLSIPMGQSGKIWGRTNCTFDRAGLGRCETGDCDGKLQCQRYGQPPVTLAEYALSNNFDFIDISLVDGFNVGMDFSPTSPQCTRGIRCVANITDECPAELKAPRGGCNGPCAVFQTDEYCCISGNCGPTDYSKFFKTRCPDAYTYPKDDETGAFGCPGGTNYKVVFCGN